MVVNVLVQQTLFKLKCTSTYFLTFNTYFQQYVLFRERVNCYTYNSLNDWQICTSMQNGRRRRRTVQLNPYMNFLLNYIWNLANLYKLQVHVSCNKKKPIAIHHHACRKVFKMIWCTTFWIGLVNQHQIFTHSTADKWFIVKYVYHNIYTCTYILLTNTCFNIHLTHNLYIIIHCRYHFKFIMKRRQLDHASFVIWNLHITKHPTPLNIKAVSMA